jgi:tetratricopeptide (TPR) repeat protein
MSGRDVEGQSPRTIQNVVHVHHVHTSGTTAVPRQLRPPPPHFTDRTTEVAALARMAAASDRRGPAVVVISGQGGIGKSALALRWLHAVADEFPDGQLYADLAVTAGTEPAALPSVLSGFLRALGVASERVPPDLGEAAALFRSLTADKRLAVLVENAVSAAQVRALLPASPRSVVVVATRWRLGGLVMDGAGFLPLVPLPPDAGSDLLARSVGNERVTREPDAVTELVTLCGGLPIALSIAGARLMTRPDWPISRVVRDLTDERRRLSALAVTGDVSVHSVFDLSYDSLPTREAQAYRWLGLHPGPWFTVDVAAAALGQPAATAAEIVESLVDASLLEAAGPDVYRFHDLVRLHARGRASHEDTSTERAGVVERMLRHYLRFAALADHTVSPQDRRLGPGFADLAGTPPAHPSATAALDAVEAELPNLMAMLRAGIDTGHDDLVWQLCEAMWSLFLRRKHFPDWLAAHRLGAEAAGRCGNDAARARMHRRLGVALHNLGRPDEAVDEGVAAVAAARAAADAGTELEALQLIGMANRARDRHADAIVALRRSVEIAALAGLRREEAISRRLLGQSLTAAGLLDEAVEQLTRARQLAADIGDDHVTANISVWLADALARGGRAPEAAVLLEDAWGSVRESGSAQHKAQLLMVWGWTAERAGDLGAARELLRRARDLYAEAGAPHVTRVQDDLDRLEARIAD